MKFIVIGDPHFKTSNALESSQFVKEVVNFINLRKDMIDSIVILGDTLDTHEKIHMQPLKRATEFIISLSRLKKVFLLIGNHDRMNNSVFLTADHPFVALKELNNIIVVDTVVKFEDYLFVPYVSNGRFNEAISEYDLTQIKCIFAHQEFKGAKMGAIISESGDEWNNSTPVISGHIHEYQIPQDNILYTGTPYQHGFSDSTDKAIVFFDGSKIKNKFKEGINFKRVKLNIIKKRIVKLDIQGFIDYKPSSMYIEKVYIEGDGKRIRQMLQMKEIRAKIKKYDIKYVIKETKNTVDHLILDKKKINFREELLRRIENEDENIIKEFEYCFGKMKT